MYIFPSKCNPDKGIITFPNALRTYSVHIDVKQVWHYMYGYSRTYSHYVTM